MLFRSALEPSQPIQNPGPALTQPLDALGYETITKLASWSKFVGIMNIFFGVCYALSIIFFSIPTFLIGIIMILLGKKLINASRHLRYALSAQDNVSFSRALDQIRSFMTLTGIMYLIGLLFFILILIMVFVFGIALFDFISDPGFDYTV